MSNFGPTWEADTDTHIHMGTCIQVGQEQKSLTPLWALRLIGSTAKATAATTVHTGEKMEANRIEDGRL